MTHGHVVLLCLADFTLLIALVLTDFYEQMTEGDL